VGNFLLVSDYLNDIKENSGKYEIFDAGINSLLDYGSAYYNNTLLLPRHEIQVSSKESVQVEQ
jgi:hypothetical protein